jgi:stage II sporulation protein D
VLAKPPGDSGGRDVSVALFSTRNLHAVTIEAVGAHSWIARCAQCAHQSLTTPLHVAGAIEVFAGGTLRVTDDVSREARTAAGFWHLRASGYDHEIDIVLILPSERYVAGVLNAEAAPDEPTQSLRALAILARTYALNGSHYTAQPGHLTADLCDSTECQAMLPGPVSKAIEDAIQATAGETLWFGRRRAEAFFSQNCGGLTEDAGAVWPRLNGVPYLHSHADPYCLRRDEAKWHAEVPLAKLAEIAQAEGWHLPATLATARVTERSTSHRARRVAFSSGNGAPAVVTASALRFGIGRALGWNRVRSDAYDLGIRNSTLVFDGRGHGHGVGLCQAGAAQMASEGKMARDILTFYFPGTAVRISPSDEGWQETHSDSIALRSTQVISAARKVTLEQAWSNAQKRFPPRRTIMPMIVFTPTTEVFRQMTTQPGWALASTRGNTIVLQPEAVLHGRDASATLLHEMLHALVEAESTERAPLWLREGLVEVLAGEDPDRTSVMPAHTMSMKATENGLAQPDSLWSSEQAHRAAAVRVRALIARYGLSSLRGWLSSGVPAGIA